MKRPPKHGMLVTVLETLERKGEVIFTVRVEGLTDHELQQVKKYGLILRAKIPIDE